MSSLGVKDDHKLFTQTCRIPHGSGISRLPGFPDEDVCFPWVLRVGTNFSTTAPLSGRSLPYATRRSPDSKSKSLCSFFLYWRQLFVSIFQANCALHGDILRNFHIEKQLQWLCITHGFANAGVNTANHSIANWSWAERERDWTKIALVLRKCRTKCIKSCLLVRLLDSEPESVFSRLALLSLG